MNMFLGMAGYPISVEIEKSSSATADRDTTSDTVSETAKCFAPSCRRGNTRLSERP
jgi:hypothetical protein